MQTILLQTFPNREFRVTLTTEKPARPFVYCDDPPLSTFVENSEPGSSRADSEDLVESSSSEGRTTATPRPGFGGLPKTRPFSLYARRQIARAGGALDVALNHEDCLFLTLTVPGSTVEAFRAVAEWSAWCVDRLKSWLCKRGATAYSLYTWEWQKRGALHLHYVAHCEDKMIANSIAKSLKQQWCRMLDSICERSGVDVWRKNDRYTHATNKDVLQVDCQPVRKSVAAYLAKYLSKSYKAAGKMRDRFFCPSRWYGISRPLNALLKSLSTSERISTIPTREASNAYETCLSLLQNTAVKCQEYKHKVGTGRTIVAYVSNSIKESICTMLNQVLDIQAMSSLESNRQLDRLVAMGASLATGNTIWRAHFTKNSDAYVQNLMLRHSSSQPLTPREKIFLLESFVSTLRWLLRTRLQPTQLESRWLSAAQVMLNTALGTSYGPSGLCQLEKLAQQGVDIDALAGELGTKEVPGSEGNSSQGQQLEFALGLGI